MELPGCHTPPLRPHLHWPGAVLPEDGVQQANELFGVDELLCTQSVDLLIEVCDLCASLDEEAELLWQVRKELLHVGRGPPAGTAAGRHLLQLVVQGRIDGANGILPAEERLAPWKANGRSR